MFFLDAKARRRLKFIFELSPANRKSQGDTMSQLIEDAAIPDSKLALTITDYVRDNEKELLFNHSSRFYHFGALAGVHRGLKFDRELLYAGAMFHGLGLIVKRRTTLTLQLRDQSII
jgi:hypothetical protein